jgi:hypothetical protein
MRYLERLNLVLLGLSLFLLVGCSQPGTTQIHVPEEVDRRITNMITGEDTWPDIKIGYYGNLIGSEVEDFSVCYEVALDGKRWLVSVVG